MWWRLGLLAVATGAVLFILFAPLMTLTIRVDIPPRLGTPVPNAGQAQSEAQAIEWIVEAAMIGAVLTVAGFIGWRVIRHHRISS
jgi:hypothetical protein